MRRRRKTRQLSFEERMALELAEAEAALAPLEQSKRVSFKRIGIDWWPEGKEPAYMRRARGQAR